MNTTHRHDAGPPPVDERDWLAQERALAQGGDPRDALLARALRTPPAASPPPGFAADMARLVTPAVVPRDEGRLERLLLNTLFVVMAAGALVVTLLYGSHWLAALDGLLGQRATQWALAGAACVALSWALNGARRLWATPPMAAA